MWKKKVVNTTARKLVIHHVYGLLPGFFRPTLKACSACSNQSQSHDTSSLCLLNVSPSSPTLGQHLTNIGSTCRLTQSLNHFYDSDIAFWHQKTPCVKDVMLLHIQRNDWPGGITTKITFLNDLTSVEPTCMSHEPRAGLTGPRHLLWMAVLKHI